jgi:hypothetical protein
MPRARVAPTSLVVGAVKTVRALEGGTTALGADGLVRKLHGKIALEENN